MSAARDHSDLFDECVWACADAVPAATLPEAFRDNIYGQCEVCSRGIMWRPHAMPEATKLCIPCAQTIAQSLAKAGEPPALAITGEAIAEILANHGPEAVADRAKTMMKFIYGEDDD